MTKEELANISMMIITHVGMAKSNAMQALKHAKLGENDKVDELLKLSSEEFINGQKYHMDVISKDASTDIKLSVIFIHAEDQMLTTQILIELVKELIEIHKDLKTKCQ